MASSFDQTRLDSISDEYNSRGLVLAERGWTKEAEKQFNKAITVNPKVSDAYDNLATLQTEKGEYFQALKNYLNAIENDPECAISHFNLGCFIDNHGHDLSTLQFEKAADLDEEFSDAHLNLGLSLIESGKKKLALSSLKEAIKLNPENHENRLQLAQTLFDLDLTREAIQHLKLIISQKSDFEEAPILLSKIFQSHGLYGQAQEILEMALNVNRNNMDLIFEVACLEETKQNIGESIKLLKKALKAEPKRFKTKIRRDSSLFLSLRKQDGFKTMLAEY